jgi:hypothetical protein
MVVSSISTVPDLTSGTALSLLHCKGVRRIIEVDGRLRRKLMSAMHIGRLYLLVPSRQEAIVCAVLVDNNDQVSDRHGGKW